jgi:GNAT superfamily N-acetyltransferase
LLQIVPLHRTHDRVGFACGTPELDAFLKLVARQHAEKGISRTFVLCDAGRPNDILGFFTLALCDARAEELPERYARMYPKHALPAVLLGRLAVARAQQGKGYGRLLLAEAVHRTALVAEQAGLIGLFVDAKDAGTRSFYEKFGFVRLPDQPLRLFLPRQTLLAARPASGGPVRRRNLGRAGSGSAPSGRLG